MSTSSRRSSIASSSERASNSRSSMSRCMRRASGSRDSSISSLSISSGRPERHLECGRDGGQRAAQFMGGVADEPVLGGAAAFQSGQHAVHRRRKVGDLVASGGDRHPLREIGARDRATRARIASTGPNAAPTSR